MATSYLQRAHVCQLVTDPSSQTIIVPPDHATAAVGDTVMLECEVAGDLTGNALTWREYITSPIGNVIYSTRSGLNGDPDKYEIDDRHGLHIKDVVLHDGGWYSCSLDSMLTPIKADVIVIEHPEVEVPEMTEGEEGHITCMVRYGGPRPEDHQESHIPKMVPHIEGLLLGGDMYMDAGRPGDASSFVPTTYNMHMSYTPTANDHGRHFSCEVRTEKPEFSVVTEQPLHVKFSVREISISPELSQLYVDDHINCSAHGYPEPLYVWQNMDEPDDIIVIGFMLELSDNMIGKNHWRCQASNNIHEDDDMVAIHHEIEFDVLPSTEIPVGSADMLQNNVGRIVLFISAHYGLLSWILRL